MKTEGGKVVKTSDVVRSQATREFRKRGKSPQSPNWLPNRAQKDFQNLETSKIL